MRVRTHIIYIWEERGRRNFCVRTEYGGPERTAAADGG